MGRKPSLYAHIWTDYRRSLGASRRWHSHRGIWNPTQYTYGGSSVELHVLPTTNPSWLEVGCGVKANGLGGHWLEVTREVSGKYEFLIYEQAGSTFSLIPAVEFNAGDFIRVTNIF